jgi:superfamily II DNA/RNA helicase
MSPDFSTYPSIFDTQQSGFADLGLPEALVHALSAAGITTPFPIQTAAIPDALAGRDLLGRGQTGSGKTLAFGLPTLARLARTGKPAPHRPKALVLVPTRELAMQVSDALAPLGRSVGLRLLTVFGGSPYDRQIFALERGVDVLVATPGRLGDLIRRGNAALDAIRITIIDEADQMADMGFLPEVTELLAQTPAGGQRLLFSATLDNDVNALVERFLTDPVTHAVAPAVAAVDTMDHHLLHIPAQEKFAVTAAIAARSGRTILFVRTQLAVDRLTNQLAEVGVRAGGLHGGKTQRIRTRTLAEFREGTLDVLVATDVAARGIHVDDVSLVVHVDPPKDSKDYLHRAGRTARAGSTGTVVTLVLPKQRKSTTIMMKKAGVEPGQLRVRPDDPALAELTGARKPSGVPVVFETPKPRGPHRATRGRPLPRRRSTGSHDRPANGHHHALGERPHDGHRRAEVPRHARERGA